MNTLERALLVAEKAHANQTYDGQVGCALHDVLEDSDLSYNDIKNAFGIEIAKIVYAVTDELGRNRKERKEKTYPKIRNNWKATVVKICDRIANIRHSIETNSRFKEMYKKEHDEFVAGIKNDIYYHFTVNAWDALDSVMKIELS